MNKDQANCAAKGAKGTAQERAGKVTASARHEARGLARQADAKSHKACDDLKQALKNSRHT